MTEIEIKTGTEEAAKLLKENPSWSYKKILNKIKEMAHSDSKNR